MKVACIHFYVSCIQYIICYLKLVEGDLRTLGSRLAQLDISKRQAVGMEDYDRAKELKDEMDDVRAEIDQMVLFTLLYNFVE